MEIVSFNRDHLEAVVRLCNAEGWESYSDDPERAWRALTAPGVITVVAVGGGETVGFASMLTDGEISSYLALIAVGERYRGQGIGKRLVQEAFAQSGSGSHRVDLMSTEGADGFYRSFAHGSWPGFRIYPLLSPAQLENPSKPERD